MGHRGRQSVYCSTTMWRPNIGSRGNEPIYLAIVNCLMEAVHSGGLRAGSRLPTQRDLARALGITVTTVTRAYAEAERRGLISGEVGRGTFVRSSGLVACVEPGSDLIDLRTNSLPPYAHAQELMTSALSALRADSANLFAYQPHAGAPAHRQAGAAWIERRGVAAPADRVIVTAGAQHAITVTLAALTRASDTVLTEALTYTGAKAVANHLQLRLEGLPVDGEGLIPDALDAACRAGARVLYCMPTIQNPIASLMSEGRRREVTELAKQHDLLIIEDDSYGFHVPASTPLAALVPERTYFIASASKSLAPGLRVAFLLAPDGMTKRLEAAVFATTVMAPPATAAMAAAWINEGLADRVVEWKRNEIDARQQIARRLFPERSIDGHASSPHLFVRLPEPWRAQDFAAHGRLRGVAVTMAEEFAAGRVTAPQAVRVCLGPPTDRAVLERALTVLAELLTQAPQSDPATV